MAEEWKRLAFYQDILNLQDAVCYDAVNGEDGEGDEIGTPQHPSNDLAHVRNLCTARKTNNILTKSAMTLDDGMPNYNIYAENMKLVIDLDGQDVSNSWFQNCSLTGEQGGAGLMHLRDVIVDDVAEIYAFGHRVWFTHDGCSVRDNGLLEIHEAKTLWPACFMNPAHIDFQGDHATGSKVGFYGASGSFEPMNMSNSNDQFYCTGSNAYITSTNNTQGYVMTEYAASLTHGNNGATETDNGSPIRMAEIDQISMLDGVWYDSGSSIAGAYPPNGGIHRPLNNLDDVYAILMLYMISKIYLYSGVTLDRTFSDVAFVGRKKDAVVDINGQDATGCHFYNCTITGDCSASGKIYLHDCLIDDTIGLCAEAWNAGLIFDAIIGIATTLDLHGAYASGDFMSFYSAPCIDYNDTSASMNITDLRDCLVLLNMTDDSPIATISSSSGAFILRGASCTTGTVILSGNAFILDAGEGGSISDMTIFGALGGVDEWQAHTLKSLLSKLGDDPATVKARFDALDAALGTKVAGRPQVFQTTVDLHNAAATYDIAVGTTEDVIVDSLIFTPHDDISNDTNITGISIQTDDTTPNTFISQTYGAILNLKPYKQLLAVGPIKVRVGQKIRITIYGGTAVADPSTCDVDITYHAEVNGGYLA